MGRAINHASISSLVLIQSQLPRESTGITITVIWGLIFFSYTNRNLYT